MTAEWDIASDEQFDKFKHFVQETDFDKLILAGDIASKSYAKKVSDWLEENQYSFTYLGGNNEQGYGVPSTTVEGWHIEHGHKFDPFFRLPKQLQISRNFLKSAYFGVRGVIKGMYGDKHIKHKGEAKFTRVGKSGKRYASFLKRTFLKILSKYLPEKSMLAHFHMFAGEAYKLGDKYVVFLEHAPNYTSLEDGKLKFHQNP